MAEKETRLTGIIKPKKPHQIGFDQLKFCDLRQRESTDNSSNKEFPPSTFNNNINNQKNCISNSNKIVSVLYYAGKIDLLVINST